MASHGWRTNRPLTRHLAEETTRFDFYQLVRLLLAERGLNAEELDRGIRFRADLGQAFPAHEVHGLHTDTANATSVAVIETGNYTLAGYMGPLPEALTEQLLARLREGDAVWSRFLDLFNHRLNALRYQLKAAPRAALNLLPPERTALAQMLLALIGLVEPSVIRQLPVPTRSVLGLAGLLADRRRSASLLTRVLARFVGAPVVLDSLVGVWRTLSPVCRTVLGVHGQAHALGQSCRLGGQAWLPPSAIRLTIGPLPYNTYCRLLPKPQGNGADIYPRFAALVRFLLDRRQDAWIVLRLAAGEAPAAKLTARSRRITEHGVDYGLRLGQTAWLHGDQRVERRATFLVPAFGEATA